MSGQMRGLSFLRDCLEDLTGLIEAAAHLHTYFAKVPVPSLFPVPWFHRSFVGKKTMLSAPKTLFTYILFYLSFWEQFVIYT